MKIAIIGSRGYPYVYSGYETFVDELAVRLVKKGHEVFVFCHRNLFHLRPAVVNGVHLIYLPAIEKKVFSQFSHSFLSTFYVLFKPMDVILFVNSANGPFGLLTRIFRKKTAINVDGLEWLRPKWRGMGSKYFKFASFLATKFFDRVVTDSEQMAKIYQQEFHSPSVTIAYGATTDISKNRRLLEKFNIGTDGYYLIVGRLIPDNNADLIIRAFERSTTKRKLVILGDVPYKDPFAESVRSTQDPRIQFPGYIRDKDELRELYCNCYAYIHGHEFGGTNPSLLKALAYGCCVLALDTVFNREVLADEKHGLFFKKSEESFLQRLEQIDENDSRVKEKRESARSRITEKYTWEKIVDQYERLFIEMVKPVNR
jgi:glycosyltransferase involved in cell wall biosynthesis